MHPESGQVGAGTFRVVLPTRLSHDRAAMDDLGRSRGSGRPCREGSGCRAAGGGAGHYRSRGATSRECQRTRSHDQNPCALPPPTHSAEPPIGHLIRQLLLAEAGRQATPGGTRQQTGRCASTSVARRRRRRCSARTSVPGTDPAGVPLGAEVWGTLGARLIVAGSKKSRLGERCLVAPARPSSAPGARQVADTSRTKPARACARPGRYDPSGSPP